MYRVKDEPPLSGLYRCTTCGVMIPMTGGETLPACPSRCADSIWTFFREARGAPSGQTREAAEAFRALDLDGYSQRIPAGARLTEVYFGPEDPGLPRTDPKLAAFRFKGQVYFGSAYALLRKTRVA